MASNLPSPRLSPDEAGEILRRHGTSGARFEGRPTVEEVAAKAGIAPHEVRATLQQLRTLGTEIDAPSGDLERIRLDSEELEDVEEDPRALARVAGDYTGVQMEGGAGKLPKATRWVLILGGLIFLAMVIAYGTKAPPR